MQEPNMEDRKKIIEDRKAAEERRIHNKETRLKARRTIKTKTIN
jgi:hypothetical protein